jgi:hypothetical protein
MRAGHLIIRGKNHEHWSILHHCPRQEIQQNWGGLFCKFSKILVRTVLDDQKGINRRPWNSKYDDDSILLYFPDDQAVVSLPTVCSGSSSFFDKLKMG